MSSTRRCRCVEPYVYLPWASTRASPPGNVRERTYTIQRYDTSCVSKKMQKRSMGIMWLRMLEGKDFQEYGLVTIPDDEHPAKRSTQWKTQ